MKTSGAFKKKMFIAILGTFLIVSLSLVTVWLYFLAHPISYVWVMDQGDYKNQTQLVKMCSNGRHLWELQFGGSWVIGYDPNRDIIWAPETGDLDDIHYEQVVQVDGDGRVQTAIWRV